MLEAAGAGDVPSAGATKPLIERMRPEGQFHGADGSRRRRARADAPYGRRPDRHGAAARRDHGVRDPVTLVSLAPMTNVAMLLTLHPDVADHLERLVFMGGSASVGNVTALAEFNVWQDPEAATCVVESGLPVTMYGLDVFNRLLVEQRWRTAGPAPATRRSAPPVSCCTAAARGPRASSRTTSGVLGDAGALLVLTHPELFTTEHLPVRVNLEGLGRGQTIVDRRPHAQDQQALDRDPWPVLEVALDADLDAAAQAFIDVVDAFAR